MQLQGLVVGLCFAAEVAHVELARRDDRRASGGTSHAARWSVNGGQCCRCHFRRRYTSLERLASCKTLGKFLMLSLQLQAQVQTHAGTVTHEQRDEI